jgi:hypothetical protein
MNEFTSEKFLACTSFSFEDLHNIVSHDVYKKYKNRFKMEDFREKLILHDMDEYTEPLYDFMLIECKKHDDSQVHSAKINDITRSNLEFQENLVETLLGLISGGKLHASITYIPKKDPIEIKHAKVINLLTEAVIKSMKEEINKLRLNFYPLSNEKAIEAINNKSDVDWIRAWMVSTGYLDPEYQSFTLDKFDSYFEKLNISDRFGAKKDFLEYFLEEFAYDHGCETPLDIQELDHILLKIRKEKSRPGPKKKKTHLKYLAFTLSALKRLDQYLGNPQINSMLDLSITSSDLRFVHDIMVFFNLIIDYSRSKKTMQSLEPTIRKMITSLNDPVTISDTYLRLQILKFSLLNNNSN